MARSRTSVRALLASVCLCLSWSACGQLLAPALDIPDRSSTERRAERDRDAEVKTLGVHSALTLSDNIYLSPSSEARSGSILEITPYAVARVDRPRSQANLHYRLRNFYLTPDEGYEGPRHDLTASGNIALKDEWLWLSARATVHDLNTSPFGTAAPDPASRSDNRSTFSRVGVLPYARGRLGTSTEYDVGFGLTYWKQGQPAISSFGKHGVGRIVRDPNVGGLGWLGSLEATQREFDNDAKYDFQYASIAALYRPIGSLRLGLSGDFSRISAVSTGSGRNSGWGPGALLTWKPSRRLDLELRASRSYFRDAYFSRLSYRAARWLLATSYDASLLDAGESAHFYPDSIGSGGPLQAERPADQTQSDAVSVLDSSFTGGLVDGALVWSRRATFSVDHMGVRNSGGITLLHIENSSVPTTTPLPTFGAPNELKQTGVLIRAARKTSLRTVIAFNGSFTRARAPEQSLTSDLTVLTASWRCSLSPQSRLELAYRRSEQRARSLEAIDYVENAILAVFDFRF